MRTDLSYILMALFLVSGISAVLSMLVLQGRGLSGGGASGLRRWHRISGYLFALFFLASLVGMLDRLSLVRAGGGLTILHVTLAVVLVPMLPVSAYRQPSAVVVSCSLVPIFGSPSAKKG